MEDSERQLKKPNPGPPSVDQISASQSPLIVIVGPTASGKTALAMEIAEKFDGEIICADSRTVYKGLDIGTAKPTLAEQKRVRHHLLDICEPSESFSVAEFKRAANAAINDISDRGKLPILVGGSGLYIDAVIYDYLFAPVGSRRDNTNPRHSSSAVQHRPKVTRKNTLIIGLNIERDVLKKRIEVRVERMIEHGFIDEVSQLVVRYPKSPALLAPGYKALSQHLTGELDLTEAKALFVRNDYQLAKRQMTWFKRNQDIQWLNNLATIDALVTTFLNKNSSRALLQ